MKKILPFILVFFLAWCANQKVENVSIDDYVKTYVVHTDSISSNNKYVWILQSNDTTYLWFKLPGRITNLYVKEGDVVKKGQLLATLDGNEVKTQFASAKQMLNSLQGMYKNTEKMFDAQIRSMQAKVLQAKTAMEGMKTWVGDTQKITKEQLATAEKQVEQAKVGLETAKTNLEHTKQVLKQKEKDIYSNSKNAIAQTKILLNNFLVFVDQLFGVSDKNKHKNDAFESYLSAKNTSLKEDIKNDWLQLNEKYENWKQKTDTLLIDINNSNSVVDDENLKQRIYDNLKQTRDLLVLSRKLADKVFTAIDSSVASRVFTQQMINQYKQQATAFQNNIESALLTAKWNFLMWVKGSIQNIENFKKQYQMQLDLLEKKYQLAQTQYETAKQTYEQYKAMTEWKLNEVDTKYKVAKKQYEEALKWLQALKEQKAAQLSQIKSQIDQVRWNKNLAAVNLWNIKLYAPYDGVITKKMANIGQVVWAWTPVYEIANPKSLKWVFYVPVEEIPHIKVGQQVIISALGEVVTGSISVIYPSADMISKKVPVEVLFEVRREERGQKSELIKTNIPDNWRLGMYITGYPASKKFDWLIIPQSFIRYEYWKPYIYKKITESQNNKITNKFEKVYIKLWKCDNDFCIVEEGLKVGDIVK